MPDLPDIDFSWYQWPDFARVALVLAAVVGMVLLWRGLRRLLGWRSQAGGSGPPGRIHRAGSSEDISDDDASQNPMNASNHEELPTQAPDPVLRWMHRILRLAAYVLSFAMVLVILVGVVSVVHTLYMNLATPPYFLIPDIIKTFGAFLAVLIAYEIFANITLYIRSDVFPMKLVIATALMAIARKVIILEMDEYTALDLVGIGAIVLGLGIAYWLITLADNRAAEGAASSPTSKALVPGSKNDRPRT